MPNTIASAPDAAAPDASRDLALLLLSRERPSEAADACRALAAETEDALSARSALFLQAKRLASLGGEPFERFEAEAAEALMQAAKAALDEAPEAAALSPQTLDVLADKAFGDAIRSQAAERSAYAVLSALSERLGCGPLADPRQDAPAAVLPRGRAAVRDALCARAAAEEAERALGAAAAAEVEKAEEGSRQREQALSPLAALADALAEALGAAAPQADGAGTVQGEANALLETALFSPLLEGLLSAGGIEPLLASLGRLSTALRGCRTASLLLDEARLAQIVAQRRLAGGAEVPEAAAAWRRALRLMLDAAAGEASALGGVRIWRLASELMSPRYAPAVNVQPHAAGFAPAAAAGDAAALEWAASEKRRLREACGAAAEEEAAAQALLARLSGGRRCQGAFEALNEIDALAEEPDERLAALSPWAAFAAAEAAEGAFDAAAAAACRASADQARQAGEALAGLRQTALRFLSLPQTEAAFGAVPHYWMRRAALDAALALPLEKRPLFIYSRQEAAQDAEDLRRKEAEIVSRFALRALEAGKGLRLEDGLIEAAADCALSCGATLAAEGLRRLAIRTAEEGRDQDEWDFFLRAASGQPLLPPYADEVRAAAVEAGRRLSAAQAAPAAAASRRAAEAWLAAASGLSAVFFAAGDAAHAALWAEKSLAAYAALSGGPASFEAEIALGTALTALHRHQGAFRHFAAAHRLARRGSPEAELAAFRAFCSRQAADYAAWKGGWSRRLAALAPAWTSPFGHPEKVYGRLDAFPIVEAAPAGGSKTLRWLVTAGASSAADGYRAIRAMRGGAALSMRAEYAMPIEAQALSSDAPAWLEATAAPRLRLGDAVLPQADWRTRLARGTARPGADGVDPVLLLQAFALGSASSLSAWDRAIGQADEGLWALEALHLAADVLSAEPVQMEGARDEGAESRALEAAASAIQLLSVPQPDGRPVELFGPDSDEGEAPRRYAALLAVPAALLQEELAQAGLSAPTALQTSPDPRMSYLSAKLAETDEALDGSGLEAWLDAEAAREEAGAEALGADDQPDEERGEAAPAPDAAALQPAAVKIIIPLYAEEADFIRLFNAEAFLARARAAGAALLPVKRQRINVCEGEDRRSVLRPADVREVIPPPLGESWCAFTESVLREGMVHVGVRFKLLPGEGLGEAEGRRDSGWLFMTKDDLSAICADGGEAAPAGVWPQIYGGALNVPATLEPGLRFVVELDCGTVILRSETGDFSPADPADVFPEGFVFTMPNGDWLDPRTGRREKPYGPAAADRLQGAGGGFSGGPSGFDGSGLVGNA